MAIDPVCGMTMAENSAAGTTKYRDVTYYFCSPRCQHEFEEAPGKFVKVDKAVEAHAHHDHAMHKAKAGKSPKAMAMSSLSVIVNSALLKRAKLS